MKAGRPQGTTADARIQRREEILGRLVSHLLVSPARLSLRELARVAGVTVPTLRHHFRDRPGLMDAIFAHLGAIGRQHHQPAMATTELSLARSIREVTARFAEGFGGPLLAIHELGLIEGFHQAEAAHSYLEEILEPSLQSLEHRLAIHVRRGELPRSLDPRIAALELVAPLFVGALHQCSLGGRGVRPLDLNALAKTIARNFLKIYGPGSP